MVHQRYAHSQTIITHEARFHLTLSLLVFSLKLNPDRSKSQ